MQKGIISASMMCADLVNLRETIRLFEKAGIDYLHIDVMDGEFVPNFGLGVDYIRGLRNLTRIPLDLHLMIHAPEYKLQWIGIQESDIVSIHYESTSQVQRALDWLEPFHCKRFLAISPATPIYVLEDVLDYIDGINLLMVSPGFAGQKIVSSMVKKAEKLHSFLKEQDREGLILEADGNISCENARVLRKLGADMFVAGTSSLFRGKIDNYEENLRQLRIAIQ